jgi:cytoskeletal protein RodZ
MSLINQALRKAQQDRSPGNRSESGPNQPVGGMPSSSDKSMRPKVIIGLIALVALLIGLATGLSVVLLKGGSAESPTVAENKAPSAHSTTSDATPSAKPTTEAAPAPLDPITATASEAAQTPAPAPARSASESSDAAPALVEELRRAREAAEAKAQAEAEAEAVAAAKAKANTPAIVEWLTESRINGVRLSPTNSKVILNGEAYGEGEYVNFQLGLKVIRIEEKRVLFADDSGKKYMKRI